jgi:hypothetical protein
MPFVSATGTLPRGWRKNRLPTVAMKLKVVTSGSSNPPFCPSASQQREEHVQPRSTTAGFPPLLLLHLSKPTCTKLAWRGRTMAAARVAAPRASSTAERAMASAGTGDSDDVCGEPRRAMGCVCLLPSGEAGERYQRRRSDG